MSAIFGEEAATALSINEIPVEQIERNQYQPRQEFEQESLAELADSIKTHGIIQPLTVRKVSDTEYQLISGERRLRASKLAGLKVVPAYVRTANDEQMLEWALIENIQREDLNPIEIAKSYERLVEEMGITQDKVASKVGKKRSTITNYLGLLKLPEQVILALRAAEISMGHAKTLKNIEDPVLQMQLFNDIREKNLSVRQAEEIAKKLKAQLNKKPTDKTEANPDQVHLNQVARQLESKFGNKVRLNQKASGNGDITIPFSNNEDLNRILEILDLV
jgi:ParB family transcriptional regulator, chromosome partitioning protein